MTRHLPTLLLCTSLMLVACDREKREVRPEAMRDDGARPVAVSALAPGGQRPDAADRRGREFAGNAFQMAEGKRLFGWFNCSGCHANGGGGMGPALIDDKWIYGSSIENIHATIRDGRPNGMPAFGRYVPDDQIWELAAYVRSLAGLAPAAAAPSRDDAMMARPAENRLAGTAEDDAP